ncbi:MAG TPA: 2'-5' RNA ligase family protein, partial [Thermoplasmata archaeon]|nr:2'-5' RNA ligase family protein [Thermoplasmata archaeon]
TVEDLRKGHGALCENGHRCAYGTDLWIEDKEAVGRIRAFDAELLALSKSAALERQATFYGRRAFPGYEDYAVNLAEDESEDLNVDSERLYSLLESVFSGSLKHLRLHNLGSPAAFRGMERLEEQIGEEADEAIELVKAGFSNWLSVHDDFDRWWPAFAYELLTQGEIVHGNMQFSIKAEIEKEASAAWVRGRVSEGYVDEAEAERWLEYSDPAKKIVGEFLGKRYPAEIREFMEENSFDASETEERLADFVQEYDLASELASEFDDSIHAWLSESSESLDFNSLLDMYGDGNYQWIKVVKDVAEKHAMPLWRRNFPGMDTVEEAVRDAIRRLDSAREWNQKVAALSLALNVQHYYGNMMKERLDVKILPFSEKQLDRLSALGDEPVSEEKSQAVTAGSGGFVRLASLVFSMVKTASADYSCVMLTGKSLQEVLSQVHPLIDKADLAPDGIEKDPHVTVLFGLHTDDHLDVMPFIRGTTIKLKDLSIFETDDGDVLKVDVESEGLTDMNRKLREELEYTNKYDDYKPHVTIAYLKTGKGNEYVKKVAPELKRILIEKFEDEPPMIHVGDAFMSFPEKTGKENVEWSAGDTVASCVCDQEVGKSLAKLLRCIQEIGGIGHSFDIQLNPDDPRPGDRRFGFDGDGSDRIDSDTIKVSKEGGQSKLSFAGSSDAPNKMAKMIECVRGLLKKDVSVIVDPENSEYAKEFTIPAGEIKKGSVKVCNREIGGLKRSSVSANWFERASSMVSEVGDLKRGRDLASLRSAATAAKVRWGREGSGYLFVCPDGTAMLLLRSADVTEPGTWGVPGGALAGTDGFHSVEDITAKADLDCLRKSAEAEVRQEIGYMPVVSRELGTTVFSDGGFRYVTFIAEISATEKDRMGKETRLNWENDRAEWFPLSRLPEGLHEGVA